MRDRLWFLSALSLVASCSGGSSNAGDGGVDAGSNDAGGDVVTSEAGGQDGSPEAGGDGGQSLTAFPSSAVFYQDISGAAVDSQWSTIAQVLAGGWGNNFQLDPSFTVLYADPSVTRRTFTQPSSALPDCDTAPTPIPAGGNIEGESNYFCSMGDDCHLLVYQGTRLYEMYQGSHHGRSGDGRDVHGICLVIWDLTNDYWQTHAVFSRRWMQRRRRGRHAARRRFS